MDIVLEGEELLVELRVPAVNVVGFEHAPHDEDEHAKVRAALATFEDAASVLVLPEEAECEVEASEAVLFRMDEDEHQDEDEHHDEDARDEDDDHGEKAERHGHDEDESAHADEEGDEEHAEEVHSELRATYHFHCHEPDRLVRIEVRAFDHLLDAEELEVRVVTPGAQTATELHPGETVVELMP